MPSGGPFKKAETGEESLSLLSDKSYFLKY